MLRAELAPRQGLKRAAGERRSHPLPRSRYTPGAQTDTADLNATTHR